MNKLAPNLVAHRRLGMSAESAMAEYHTEIRDGGEPDFPWWARDAQELLRDYHEAAIMASLHAMHLESLRVPPPDAQTTTSAEPCPYQCGWERLHTMATRDGAYLAKSLQVGHLLTDNERATAIVTSVRLIEVCRAMIKGQK